MYLAHAPGSLRCSSFYSGDKVVVALIVMYLPLFVGICVCLFIDALWSPAGKRLTSWLSFGMSNCEDDIFPLVSLVRCGA